MSRPKRLKFWILDLKVGLNKLGIRSGLEGKNILYLLLHWSKSKRPSAPYLKRRSTKVHTGTKSRTRSFLEDVQYPAMLTWKAQYMAVSDGGATAPTPRFRQICKPYSNQGRGRLWPPHYYLPPPDCQTFLWPCTMVSPLPLSAASGLLNFLVST